MSDAPLRLPAAPRLPRLRLLDPLLLVAVALLLWQAIAAWTQGVAVSAPLPTFAYLGDLLLTDRFWACAASPATWPSRCWPASTPSPR
jgi:hypothetical protein